MKKQLFFLSAFVLCLFTAHSQITITQSDMPSLGYVATEANDTLFTGITPGTSGTNQTWNFSGMLNHTQDITGFVTPGSLSGSGNFPTANLAATNPATQDIYINSNSSSLDILGAYGDFGSPVGVAAIKFNPLLKKITFPSNYNTAYSGSYTYDLKSPYSSYPGIDSIKMHASVSYNSLIDGWGSITTPAFSSVASLRQKFIDINTTTSYIHLTGGSWMSTGAPTIDTTNTYTWWSNTVKYPLAEIQTNGTNATTSVKYLLSMQAGGVGIQVVATEKNAIIVYPNPSQETIHITGVSETVYFVVSDVTGKLVGNSLLKNFTNSYTISNFENGVYFYQAIDLKGNVVGKGKFVVAK